MRPRSTVLFALAILAGCASDRYTYAPVQTTGAEIAGQPAVVYSMPPEAPRGEVRVATFGAATPSTIHAALVVSNRSDETWTVDGADQELSIAGVSPVKAAMDPNATPVRVEVPPRSTRWIDLFFPIPSDVAQGRAMPAFAISWTLRVGGRALTQRTSFARVPLEDAALPASGGAHEPNLMPGHPLPLPGSEPPSRWPLPAQ